MKNRAAHPIACMTLTKDILDDILSSEYNSMITVLVSSLGNLFTIGDTSDFEIVEFDEFNLQYIITDASGAKRYIMFTDGQSDYGIMYGPNGYAMETTGIKV